MTTKYNTEIEALQQKLDHVSSAHSQDDEQAIAKLEEELTASNNEVQSLR